MTVRVLIAYGSRMGSTAEIAEAIGRELRAHGAEVDVVPAERVDSVRAYESVIVGSAIYAGRWRRAPLNLLRRNTIDLMHRHVWLFQSGLSAVGPGPWKDATPPAVARLARIIGAANPVAFPGRLTRETARGVIPRLFARGPGAGDHRDWDRIRGWAADVARQIVPADPAGGVSRAPGGAGHGP